MKRSHKVRSQQKRYFVTVPIQVAYRATADNRLIATYTTTVTGVPLTPAHVKKIEGFAKTFHTSYEYAFMSLFKSRYTRTFLEDFREQCPDCPDVRVEIQLHGTLTWAKGSAFPTKSG